MATFGRLIIHISTWKCLEKYYSVKDCFKILTNISQPYLIIILKKKYSTYHILLDTSILQNMIWEILG